MISMIYRWLQEDGRRLDAGVSRHSAVSIRSGAEFIAVQMPQPAVVAASTDIVYLLCCQSQDGVPSRLRRSRYFCIESTPSPVVTGVNSY